MKHALRLYAITILFSATALQCSQIREIKVSKSGLIGAPDVYVQLYQGNTKMAQGIVSTFHPDILRYGLNNGTVTIQAQMTDEYGKTFSAKDLRISVDELIGKKVRISDSDAGPTWRYVETRDGKKSVRNYYPTIYTEWADAPSVIDIRTYKTTEDKVEWTVVITDNQDKEITRTTFKKNTGNLYLQLNSYEITNTNDPNIRFNANKISVFKGKDTTGSPIFLTKTVKWNEFDSNKPELEISATGANFVAKGTEKKSKVPDKKIRAYKNVDEKEMKVDWTVQITDNSDNEISHSTFKKNTDRFARSLYLRLNPAEVPADASEIQKRYNANKVKVFKGKKVTQTPLFEPAIITAIAYAQAPDSELQITDTEAKLVAKGLEKK